MIALCIISIYIVIGLVFMISTIILGRMANMECFDKITDDICNLGITALIVYVAIFSAASLIWPILLGVTIVMSIRS